MRKLLNTLYITNPNAYLSRDGDNIVIKVDDNEVGRRPIHILESIVCFTYNGISPSLMKLCSTYRVSVCFANQYGSFSGRIQGKINGNVLLRRTQYRVADDEEKSLEISKVIILAKVVNSKKIVNRVLRDHKDKVDNVLLECIQVKLKDSIESIPNVKDYDSLRGIEGDSARTYFQSFNELILKQKEDFFFVGRNRRPPQDNVNALLSFAYTLIANEVASALETVGLDPYVGFFHTDRPGRVSLALDMMEELRAYLGDRFVLSIINRKQLDCNGFIKKENGGVLMTDDARKAFLEAWQKRKQEIIKHPFLKENIEIGLIPYAQAMLMARFLRGDLEAYPPFFIP